MTKRFSYIFIFFFSAFLAAGQIHPLVKQIFYDLPLDKTRSDLREIIAHDQRFRSTDTASETVKNLIPYFRGVTTDKGLITSTPEAIEILLTFGNSPSVSAHEGQTDLILNVKYFYSVKDSAEAGYRHLIKILPAAFKDSRDIKVETPYSGGSTRYEFTAAGKLFENFNPYYRVEIVTASMANNTYGLFVEFRCKEK
jgi:hypothetical protein